MSTPGHRRRGPFTPDAKPAAPQAFHHRSGNLVIEAAFAPGQVQALNDDTPAAGRGERSCSSRRTDRHAFSDPGEADGGRLVIERAPVSDA